MGSSRDGLKRLRRTLTGYSQGDLCSILEAVGYEFQREGRHGKIYRHARLAAEHPDLDTRKRYAYVVVQKGSELKAGAAKDVMEALEVLEAWEKDA